MSAEPTDLTRRAPRITAEDVFAAADMLLGEGHKPTIDRVRMQLGRGSPNTINEHLDRWWRELGARFRASAGLALPNVPAPISSRLIELWNLALHESEQALQTQLAEREAALLAREMAVTEREAVVEGQLQAQADALHLAQTQLAEANQRARGLEITLYRARGDLEALDTQATAARAQLPVLRQQLDTFVEQHAAERARLNERYDALQARSAREIDQLRLTQKDDKKQLKELRTQFERTAIERDRARTEITRLESELATVRGLNERLLTPPAAKAVEKRVPTKRVAKRRARHSPRRN